MELKDSRQEIDAIDEQLVGLFRRRMEIAQQIGEYKRENGLQISDGSRERTVLEKVGNMAGEELAGYARTLYSSIFNISKSYQISKTPESTALGAQIRAAAKKASPVFPKNGVVACQGVEGAYSQIACDRLFSMPSILYFRSFEGVFQAVEKGLCRYGVLPIENSSYGSVGEVYDLMRNYNFHVVRSTKLHISHNLLARSGVALKDVREIFSHEQAIGQCSEFLAKHPDIKVTVCENTAVAAKLVAESGRTDIAALSSHNCAELYGLTVLSDHVQNNENNYTRFICITKDLEIFAGANHISLMFSLSHRPGSLYDLLAQFAALGLNMTKLESRPIPGSDFEFMFYVDFEASVWNDDVVRLLAELSGSGEKFAFLGSYSEV